MQYLLNLFKNYNFSFLAGSSIFQQNIIITGQNKYIFQGKIMSKCSKSDFLDLLTLDSRPLLEISRGRKV